MTASDLGTHLTRTAFNLLNTVVKPRLSILIFHRVHAETDNIFPHEIDAVRFERLMHFVSRCFRVISLGEAINHLTLGQLPSRAMVISFDDGYADNAEVALPILQRFGLTASFFVSSGFLDGGLMWNDSVIESLRACRHSEIDLGLFGLERLSLRGASEKRLAITSLLAHIKYLNLAERAEAINKLQDLCGVKNLPINLMMSSAQVREMHQAGMEIGAHTVRHPILTTLTFAEAEYEIAEGRNQLQSIIDAPVDLFAYPNGKPGSDYDHTHASIVKNLGFRGAVSTAPGAVLPGHDLYQLPRYTPWGNSLTTWSTRLILNQRNTRFQTALPPQKPDAESH